LTADVFCSSSTVQGKAHAMKAYSGSRSIAAVIFNVSTEWK